MTATASRSCRMPPGPRNLHLGHPGGLHPATAVWCEGQGDTTACNGSHWMVGTLGSTHERCRTFWRRWHFGVTSLSIGRTLHAVYQAKAEHFRATFLWLYEKRWCLTCFSPSLNSLDMLGPFGKLWKCQPYAFRNASALYPEQQVWFCSSTE